MMLPTYLSDIIPQNHVVREVNNAIERMDIAPLHSKYEGGGTSSFHPKMMLKVLVYAYIEKIFSSREIAKSLMENINFMWISGGNRPDDFTG
jgi:transposase